MAILSYFMAFSVSDCSGGQRLSGPSEIQINWLEDFLNCIKSAKDLRFFTGDN